jgi:hypothetical protein
MAQVSSDLAHLASTLAEMMNMEKNVSPSEDKETKVPSHDTNSSDSSYGSLPPLQLESNVEEVVVAIPEPLAKPTHISWDFNPEPHPPLKRILIRRKK